MNITISPNIVSSVFITLNKPITNTELVGKINIRGRLANVHTGVFDSKIGVLYLSIPSLKEGSYSYTISDKITRHRIDSGIITVSASAGDGKSAYEIAVEYGAKMTEEEWLASLKGDKGDDGVVGKDGPQGLQGEQGLRGDDGAPGYTPIKGIDYFDGSDATVTKSAVESVLTGEISSHTHAMLKYSGLTKITVGISEPENPNTGDLWIDTGD